jgi:hypothetical protein
MSAAQRVFNIYELSQPILELLPAWDVILMSQFSSLWSSIIQRSRKIQEILKTDHFLMDYSEAASKHCWRLIYHDPSRRAELIIHRRGVFEVVCVRFTGGEQPPAKKFHILGNHNSGAVRVRRTQTCWQIVTRAGMPNFSISQNVQGTDCWALVEYLLLFWKPRITSQVLDFLMVKYNYQPGAV